MTPIVRRLKTRQQFLKVAGTRQKWVAPGLILQSRRRPAVEPPAPQTPIPIRSPRAEPLDDCIRVGFTVSKKVGNAVARNRARRRLRAAAATLVPQAGRAGHDYVLIGRKETLTRDFSDLMDDLRTALSRVGKKKPAKGQGTPYTKGRGKGIGQA